MKIICNWTRALSATILTTAALSASAGTELIQNGDFEQGNATDKSWGAYATSANINAGKYSNPGWTVSSGGGLAKPDATWLASGLAVGNWALYLQNNAQTAYQDVTVPAAGTYRLSFNWTARPNHGGQTIHVKFGDAVLDTFTTSATVLMHWRKDFEVPAAGTYRLMFESQTSGGDRATCFDAVSLRALDDARVWTGGGNSTSISDAGNWGGTPGEAITFTSDDYLVFDKAATVTVPADITVKGVKITGDGAVTLSGEGKITVAGDIYSDASADMVFNCPVAFDDTYFVVKQGDGRVRFPGGVTASYPDPALRTDIATNAGARTLDGEFTFTADWIVNNVGDYPWIVASNSVVRGQNFSGTQTSHHRILRVEETGYACFTTVTNGWDRGDIDIDGMLEATEEMIVRTKPSSASDVSHFGRSGNIGTVKAKRIAKAEHAIAQSLIPNLIVGSGGMGSLCKDYLWRFDVDTTITASDDFEFLGIYNSGNPADWGISISAGVTLTINVPEGKTVTCGIGVTNSGAVRKTGAGTLVMTDTFDGQSGFNKNYSGGTAVDEGVVRLAGSVLGTGSVTVASGARLEIAGGVAVSNQIDGEGTLALEDGVSLTMGNIPWSVGTVEVASGANISVTNSIPGAFAFLTGVSAADLASFSFGDYPLTIAGDTLCYVGDTTGAYVWNGASGADWSVAGNWLVDGTVPATAPASTDTIIFKNAAPITIGGTDTLTVTNITTLSDDLVTFNCPVQFAGTYLVENAATAPRFAGGATATYPDESLTGMNIASHALNGAITFTENWTIPAQVSGKPFVLEANSTIDGKNLYGTSNAQISFTVGENATATFDAIELSNNLVFKLAGGRLVARGDVTMSSLNVGTSSGNVGTLEANGIYKSARAGNINLYVTNFVVGAGGFGMYRADYNFQFMVNARLTAKDNLTIYVPLTSDGSKENDWGLNLNSKTLTIDTAGHTVTFDSCTTANAGVIVKEGEGEMIMQNRLKQHTGGTILKGGLTTVKTSGALGYGTATVNSGATLRFADTVTSFAYPIVVNAGGTFAYEASVTDSSTLTLAAGAILKPTQGAVFSVPDGNLTLPEEGTVMVDMRDFSLVNGVASAIVGGVSAGDEAKFTVLVPSGVVGSLSVSGGFLYYTPTSGGSAAADLFWHPAGEDIWSTSVAAWTNAAGTQVTFTPYANATIADAATISVTEDVPANDVTVAADGNVTLEGVGTLGGIGNVTKRGSGTLTLDGANFDGQNFTIAEGKVVLGDNAGAHSLGTDSGSVGGTVTVQEGGQFNVNTQNTAGNDTDARFEISQLKTFSIAGDGPDGRGAIVNDSLSGITTGWGPALRRVELADDATIGGANRYDVRVRTGTAATSQGGIFGPGKQLTVKCPGFFGLISLPIDVESVLITDGGVFRPEGMTEALVNIPGGITLDNGTLHGYASTYPATMPLRVAEGGGVIDSQSGTTVFNAPVVVAENSSLTLQGGYTVNYTGGVTNNGAVTVSAGTHNIDGGAIAGSGEWNQTGGSLFWYQTATLDSPKTLNLSGGTFYYGKETSGLGKLNQKLTVNATGGTFAFNIGASTTLTSADVEINDDGKGSIRLYGKKDPSMVVRLEGIKANVNYVGTSETAGNANYTFGNGVDISTASFIVNQASGGLSSIVRVEEGASLTVGNNLTVGDSTGTNEYRMVVDGGRVVCEGTSPLHMAYQANAGYLDFLSGEIEVPGIWCRIEWWSPLTYDEKFTMDGGTLSITGAHATNPAIGGYTRFKPFIEFNNGRIVSLGNWAVQQMLAVSFGDKAGGHVELDVADKTVDWRTGITGAADVTLKGGGTFKSGVGAAGYMRFQGVATGKWKVENTGVNDLYGASGFMGGLHLATNVTANVRIGGSNLVEAVFLQTGSGKFAEACTWSNAYPFACNDLTLLHAKGVEADYKNSVIMWQGQFYADTAGTWTFAAGYDDSVRIDIDGQKVMECTTWNAVAKGSIDLTEGWHDFRIVQYQAGGGWGTPASGWANVMNVGFAKEVVDNVTAASYTKFDADHIPLRPGPVTRGPGGWVNWHAVHQKTDWNTRTDWTFESVTNNISMLDIYNLVLPETIGNSVHMFDGWVYVPRDKAGDWAVYVDFDDYASMKIDGVDSGATGQNNAAGHNGSIPGVTCGWHRFELRVCDTGGNWGPWSGTTGQAKNPAFKITVNGATYNFTEKNFYFSATRPAEYAGIDGELRLDAGATLANAATQACPIWGTLKGTGTLSGPFAFAGATNCWEVADASASGANLPAVAFANASAETFAGLKSVRVLFDAKPSRHTYFLTDVISGLTAADLPEAAVIVADGENDYSADFTLTVKNGRLALANAKARGTFIIVR